MKEWEENCTWRNRFIRGFLIFLLWVALTPKFH